MPYRAPSCLLVLVTLACADRPPAQSSADSTVHSSAVSETPIVPSETAVTPRGIGRLEAGMTLDQAAGVVPGTLVVAAGTDAAGIDAAGCTYATWRDGPPGVRVMLEGGRVVRIDIDSTPVRTTEGAGVGDSEERIQSLYAGRVVVTPLKYEDGHYLTVRDASDSTLALVFEATAGRVTRYRAGRRPQVEYVEGCS